MGVIILIWIVQALIMAIIPAMIAVSKGREGEVWFLYGFLVWPIALVHALLIPPADSVTCKFCTKQISREATVCPYCQRELASARKFSDSERNISLQVQNSRPEGNLLIVSEVYRSKGQPRQSSIQKTNESLTKEDQSTKRELETSMSDKTIWITVAVIVAVSAALSFLVSNSI